MTTITLIPKWLRRLTDVDVYIAAGAVPGFGGLGLGCYYSYGRDGRGMDGIQFIATFGPWHASLNFDHWRGRRRA